MPEQPLIPPLPEQGTRPPKVPLRARRCVRHEQREAAGLCKECGRDFCRECLGEHDGRLLCAACSARMAKALASARAVGGGAWGRLGRGSLTVASFLILWGLLLLLGLLLVRIPPDFHRDKMWREMEAEQQ